MILRRGFTLIEIMLVVIIIGILVAMLVPNIAGRSEQARKTAARTDIESNISTALDLYKMDVGQYPTTEQGLSALLAPPTASPVPANWNGPYIEKDPLDPWGRPYIYASPGEHRSDYDLSSKGKDESSQKDGINNWQ